MNTTLAQEAEWLQSQSADLRSRFLAALSHNLTIGIRVLCFEATTSTQGIEGVRVLNEAHHRVSSYLSHTLAGDENTRWIPVVVEYVLSPTNVAAHTQAVQAWANAKQLVGAENAP